MPKLIKNWDELKKCTSETHTLEIGDCQGWTIPNKKDEKHIFGGREYLSSHTFYGSTHEWSTKYLQACGFDVEIDNWDKGE